jgi:hypothetical protein
MRAGDCARLFDIRIWQGERLQLDKRSIMEKISQGFSCLRFFLDTAGGPAKPI